MTPKDKIIASLTTYGERINTVHLTIQTILNQTLKADIIILWLAKDEFNDNLLPNGLTELKKYNLEIKYCEDIKSYKKLIPTLKLYPNDIIITFDDDVLYKDNIIERLYNSYLKDSSSIHCMRGHKITFNEINEVQSYNQWTMISNDFSSKYDIFPTGVAGILYFPNCFHEEVLNENNFLKLAPHGDDIWFKAMSLLNGTKSKIVEQDYDELNNLNFIQNTQEDGLWSKINRFEEKGNDYQIKSVFETYGIYDILNKKIKDEEKVLTNIYNNELISIIITTCNRSTLLKRALKSAVKQTYKNLEIIVIDDASNDNTETIVQKFIKKYPYIRYIKNSQNLGSNKSRNIGIKNANGKFIAGLDDDDEFINTRIQTLVKNYNPEYSFITSNNIVIKPNKDLSYTKNEGIIHFNDMLNQNRIGNQGLIEKKRLIEINLYDENLLACQDYDIWIRLIMKYGSAKILPEYLQIIHEDDNILRISTKSKIKSKGYFQFYKKYKKFMNKSNRRLYLYNLYRINKKILSKNFALILTDENTENTILNWYVKSTPIAYNILISFYKYISQLSINENYIIYGYGSVGKMIASQLRNNIVGIIDQSIKMDNVDNFVVLKVEDLIDFKNIKVLITPVLQKNEIIQSITPYHSNFEVVDLFL